MVFIDLPVSKFPNKFLAGNNPGGFKKRTSGFNYSILK